jgi:hypothetical protein
MDAAHARKIGEKLGVLRQAEARLSEWPTLSDRHVVACVEAYIKARDEFQDAIKEVKQ